MAACPFYADLALALVLAVSGAVLSASQAAAQDATWRSNPGSGDWNTGSNWSSGSAPTGTATFDNSTTTNLTLSGITTIGGLEFNAGAPAYDFDLSQPSRLTINGVGIVNNSSNSPTFNLGLPGELYFINSATAGDATIILNLGTAAFSGASTAGDATITTNIGSVTSFYGNSTAGNATITTENGASTFFVQSSTGGQARFITNSGARFDISSLTGSGMTAGSIEGAGSYFLGSKQLTVGGNDLSTTVSGVIADGGNSGGTGGALAKVGAGTLTLTGANTYSGGTTVSAGTLRLSGAGTLGSTSGGLTVDGGTLDLDGTSQTVGSLGGNGGAITLGGGALTVDQSTVTAYSGAISGAGSLTKAGNGTLTLTGTNTYSGGTTVTGGLVNFSTTSNFGSGSITLDGGGLQWATGNSIDISSNLAAIGNGGATFDTNDNNVAFATALAGGGSITKTGTGTLTLSGVNAYSGGTTILGGVVQISTDGNLGSSSASLAVDGGTLRINGIAGIARDITLGANNGTFDNASLVELQGDITGTGDLVKTGAGLLRLSGNNSYAGDTNVTEGSLIGSAGSIRGNLVNDGGVIFEEASNTTFAGNITGGGQMGKTGAGVLTLTGTSKLDWTIAGGGLVSAANRFSGDIAIGAGAFFTFDQSADAAYAGVLSGDGDFVKDGSSALTLTETNTYTGATTVDAGTLLVNGSIAPSSGVTVGSGATLGGSGVVAPTVIQDGGRLAPGNSIGTVTVNGSLTFAAGSVYEVEVSPGAADRTNVVAVGGPGTADLSGATVLANYEPGSYVAKQYVIVNAAGGFGGTAFAGLAGAAPSGFTQLLSYDASNVYLVLSPLQLAGLSGNQQAVSGALVAYFNETGGLPSAFTGLTAGGLTLISAENGTGAHAAGLGSGSEFISLLGGMPGMPAGGDASERGAGPLAYGPDEPDRLAERFEAGFPAAGVEAPDVRRYSMWGSVMGGASWLAGSAAAGSQNVAASGYGLASGIDYAAEGRFVGGALGGSWTSSTIGNGLGSGRAGSFHAGIRAGAEFGRFYVTGAAGYGFHDLSTSRPVGGETYTANFTGHSFSARAEAGARWRASFADVMPYAVFQSVNLFTPAYTETASGAGTFALAYQVATSSENRIEVGARLSKRLAYGDGSLTLSGGLAWAHYLDRGRAVSAGFTALPGTSFVTQGAAKARNTALVSAGADFQWRSGVAAALSLDGEFGQGTASIAGKATLRLKW